MDTDNRTTESDDVTSLKRGNLWPATVSQREEREILGQWLQRSLGPGEPLEESARGQAERWFGRKLGDVRVHDSHQAAEIARRLNADAFALQSHIVGAADKLTFSTPHARGILAHEITHVIQQTDPPPTIREDGITPASEHRGSASDDGWRERHGPRQFTNSRVERTRQPSTPSSVPSSPYGESGRISLKASPDALQRTAEEEALVSEEIVSSALANQEKASEQDSGTATSIDPHELASRVYRLMQMDLVLERERGALPR